MIIKSNQNNMKYQLDDYEMFSNWLDKILEKDLPKDIVAFNFNLYEGEFDTYDIQLIGSNEFDISDEDWAYSDYFTTGENLFFIDVKNDILNWEDGLCYITELLMNYLELGKYADILKKANVIGIGFVDGDINIIYKL